MNRHESQSAWHDLNITHADGTDDQLRSRRNSTNTHDRWYQVKMIYQITDIRTSITAVPVSFNSFEQSADKPMHIATCARTLFAMIISARVPFATDSVQGLQKNVFMVNFPIFPPPVQVLLLDQFPIPEFDAQQNSLTDTHHYLQFQPQNYWNSVDLFQSATVHSLVNAVTGFQRMMNNRDIHHRIIDLEEPFPESEPANIPDRKPLPVEIDPPP